MILRTCWYDIDGSLGWCGANGMQSEDSRGDTSRFAAVPGRVPMRLRQLWPHCATLQCRREDPCKLSITIPRSSAST